MYVHSFFDLATRWRWVVSFTPLPLYPQVKSPWYPEPFWTRWWREKFPAPCRESNPTTPIVQPVAQLYTDWFITALWYKYQPIPFGRFFEMTSEQNFVTSDLPIVLLRNFISTPFRASEGGTEHYDGSLRSTQCSQRRPKLSSTQKIHKAQTWLSGLTTVQVSKLSLYPWVTYRY
jgi:hypothetical protein